MALNQNTYENFYLGNATEFWIASQLYFHGFEASKYSPDFGIDLVVTNAARAKFRGEELWTKFLQIKSTFLVGGKAKIYMNPEELEFLCSTPNIACVFCLVTPHIKAQPRSFDRGDFEPWRDSLDA